MVARGWSGGWAAGLAALLLAGCGTNDPFAGSGACGEAPAEPGPDGCALTCQAELPLRLASGVPTVAAWINGQPIDLILDTGLSNSALTPAGAASLGLGPPLPAPGSVAGIGGRQPRRVVAVESLSLGPIRLGPRHLDVLSFGAVPAPPAGSVGQDILRGYDVDLDLPHGAARLYAGSACPGPPPGWTEPGTALPLLGTTGLPVVAASLDGRPVRALIDTGSAASAAGHGPGRADRHAAGTLRLGNATVSDFPLDLIDLDLPETDLLIGADDLARRRLWFGNSRRELRIGAAP